MFPDRATLFAAPYCDAPLYDESMAKVGFWGCNNFYGVDLTALRDDAHSFYFSQPVVGPVSPHTLLATECGYPFDFGSMSAEALRNFTMPLSFTFNAVTPIHGICLWFDTSFPGGTKEIVLSTSPCEPLTHWYQVRCMLKAPLAVGPGHKVTGSLRFEANESRGYNIHMSLTNVNSEVTSTNVIVTQCALHHFQYSTQASAQAYYPQQQQQQQQQPMQWQATQATTDDTGAQATANGGVDGTAHV
jgi:histone-arginine methyltransferase CARM1